MTSAPGACATRSGLPTGPAVLYSSNIEGRIDLWTVSAAGGGPPRRLTTSGNAANWARWSPDGREIAFVSGDGGPATSGVIPADGGEDRGADDGAGRARAGRVGAGRRPARLRLEPRRNPRPLDDLQRRRTGCRADRGAGETTNGPAGRRTAAGWRSARYATTGADLWIVPAAGGRGETGHRRCGGRGVPAVVGRRRRAGVQRRFAADAAVDRAGRRRNADGSHVRSARRRGSGRVAGRGPGSRTSRVRGASATSTSSRSKGARRSGSRRAPAAPRRLAGRRTARPSRSSPAAAETATSGSCPRRAATPGRSRRIRGATSARSGRPTARPWPSRRTGPTSG